MNGRKPVVHGIRKDEDGAYGLACALPFPDIDDEDDIIGIDSEVTCTECRNRLKPVGVDW